MKTVKEKCVHPSLNQIMACKLLYYNIGLLKMANMQIEELENKHETDEKELKSLLDEINTLKVESWICSLLFLSYNRCSFQISFS